jgi:hypothetical protein
MIARTKSERIFLFMAVLALVAGMTQNLFASPKATVGLCAGPGTHYTTIQAAVTASASGTIIDVCPGAYPEQVVVTKSLTLIGITSGASDAAVIVCPAGGCVQNATDIGGSLAAAQIFVQGATDVTISHLTVDGSNNQLSGYPYIVGIYYQNSSGTITDSVVRNQIPPTGAGDQPGGLGINIESNTGSPAVTVSDNSVRNYDKNGITADGLGNGSGGPVVTVKGNTVAGMGATTVTAQNGIQIGFGATGTVTGNYVTDVNYTPATYTATGILIYGSSGVTVSSNTVESAQSGIYPVSAGPDLSGDNTVVTSNHIGNTMGWDAIDLCSNNNTAESNIIYGTSEAGVHDDDECTEPNSSASGNGNTIEKNTINEACAGILTGSDATGTYSGNTFLNVTTTMQSGDSCTLLNVQSQGKHRSLRPAPYSLIRK